MHQYFTGECNPRRQEGGRRGGELEKDGVKYKVLCC